MEERTFHIECICHKRGRPTMHFGGFCPICTSEHLLNLHMQAMETIDQNLTRIDAQLENMQNNISMLNQRIFPNERG